MTIELTTEDLIDIQEQAARYGACALKLKTTDGDDVWIVLHNHRKPTRRQKAATEPAATTTQ